MKSRRQRGVPQRRGEPGAAAHRPLEPVARPAGARCAIERRYAEHSGGDRSAARSGSTSWNVCGPTRALVRVARLRHLHHSGDRALAARARRRGGRSAERRGMIAQRSWATSRSGRTTARRPAYFTVLPVDGGGSGSAALPPELPARSARPRQRRSDLRDRPRRFVRGGVARGGLQRRHPGGGDAADLPAPRRAPDHRAGDPHGARSHHRAGGAIARAHLRAARRHDRPPAAGAGSVPAHQRVARRRRRGHRASSSGASSIASKRRTSCT